MTSHRSEDVVVNALEVEAELVRAGKVGHNGFERKQVMEGTLLSGSPTEMGSLRDRNAAARLRTSRSESSTSARALTVAPEWLFVAMVVDD